MDNDETSVLQVHDIVDELADAAAEHQEIQESVATGASTFTKADEDDLEEELKQILQEEAEEEPEEAVPFLPPVPTEPITGSGDATRRPADEKNSLNSVGEPKRVRLGYFE